MRFALLWFAIPLLVISLSAHQKMRYLLSMYPGAALLVAWWADTYGSTRTLARRVTGWLALGSAAVTIVALHVPPWWGSNERLYLSGASWRILLPVAAGVALIGGTIFWALRAGRPALLVQGVVGVMTVILGYGIWPYTQRYNELWNFKHLAASVERYAGVGEAAVFIHRHDWMSLDFYLRHPPRSITTVEELNDYLGRHNHPVVVMADAAWRTVRPRLSLEVTVLERVTIGRETLLIVKAAAPLTAEHRAQSS